VSVSLLLWFALALTVFWAFGVYSRLNRLRTRGLEALVATETHLNQCADLLSVYASKDHCQQSEGIDGSPERALLVAQLQALTVRIVDARSAALNPQTLMGVNHAFEDYQRAWARSQDAPAVLAQPGALQSQLEAASESLHAAHRRFNYILWRYNEAVSQFPARLIARVLGFKQTGLM